MRHLNLTAAEFSAPGPGAAVWGESAARTVILRTLLSIATLMLIPAVTPAQSALSDDAHVSLAYPSANHGSNPNLSVSSSENAYLKFILSTLPVNTPGSEVEKATLKLYVGKIKSAGKLDVYAVAGQWDANSITANNVPPLGSLVTTTAQIATDHEGKFLSVDLPHRLYQ